MICQQHYLKDYFPILGADGCNPVLDVYLPHTPPDLERENEKRPCILICPGGAYRRICPREGEPIALNFLPQGFHVFVLTYSTAPHCFPTQLRQVAAALELIRKNAESWGCDLSRMTLMGFSAGGHLAAHYSNCYDCPEVRAVFPDSLPVQACILGYPVITGEPAYGHENSFENLSGHTPVTQEDRERFSLERHVTEKTPPTFLWHTAADKLVPVENSLCFAAALSAAKVPFELHVFPQGGHGMSTCTTEVNTYHPYNARWVDWSVVWLNKLFEFEK